MFVTNALVLNANTSFPVVVLDMRNNAMDVNLPSLLANIVELIFAILALPCRCHD